MKEGANGYNFKSCDDEAAINVVNAQTESGRQIPFSTDCHRASTSRHGKTPVSEIELGNNVNLNLLLSRLGKIFPQQDYSAEDNTLQAVLGILHIFS